MLFHDVILEAAASERLTQMVRKVIQLPLVYRSYYWYSPEQKLISEHYHRQLTSAMASRDAERAEIVMKEHVLEARDFLIARFRDRDAGGDGEEAA
jgi:DNA-binding GntR family transcriptional regulator